MLAIVEENKGLQIRITELQKMVDLMISDKKSSTARAGEQTSSPPPDEKVR